LAQHHRCDWCEVPAGCGEWSWTRGSFDFCNFRQEDSFASITAAQKLDTLWGKVRADDTPQALMGIPTTVGVVLTMSMITTFDNPREVHPEGREKVIHGQGAVLQFDLEVQGNSPYTGMLMPGKHRGLMRLGSAFPANIDVFPGIAIKFLRSGIHSANSNLLRNTGELNGRKQFFEEWLSNHVTPPSALTLLNKFNQASACQSMTGLSDMCSYTQDGSRVKGPPQFPYEIRFEAPEDPMQFSMDFSARDRPVALLKALTNIPQGTHLYNVLAKASPTAPWKNLGKVFTRSKSVTSNFGDTRLSFRHQRMEEDFMWHPDWIEAASKDQKYCDDSTDGAGNLRPISDWQCPYATGVPPIPQR